MPKTKQKSDLQSNNNKTCELNSKGGCVLANAFHPSTWKAEADTSLNSSHFGLCSKCQAIPGLHGERNGTF